MTVSIRMTSWIAVLAMILAPTLAVAQDEYDEEAAGGVDYADEEAAGTAGEAAEGGLEAGDDLNATAAAAQDEKPSEREKLHSWEWGGIRHHSNLKGSTGLLRITEAGSDEAGTFGIGLHGGWFTYDDFLVYGDENTRTWGDINLRVTPLDFLEIYAGLKSQANYNSEEYPRLFQALGDMDVGLKGFISPADFVTLGLDFGVTFLNSVGDISTDWDSTSFGIDLLTSFDFAEVEEDAPIGVFLQVGYYFDNSATLVEDFEAESGGCGTDKDGDGFVEYEGCLSPVERFALNINRNDQLRVGLGLDMALPYITPIVEYTLEVPINRQDFTCPTVPNGADSCMDEEGGAAFRQLLTFGLRVLPPIESLAIDIGADLGLSGYAPTVHELAAAVPYQILFGASYSFDPFQEPPPPPPPPPAPPASPPPPPPPAEISGFVHDAASAGKPVPEAQVTYVGHDLNPQVTGRDGRFRSYPLPAGQVTLAVSAEGYKDGSFAVEIPSTGVVDVDCPLEALPKNGTLVVRIVSEDGQPLSGIEVGYSGPTSGSGTTGSDGRLQIEVKEGEYALSVDNDKFLRKQSRVQTKLDTKVETEMQLSPKPKKSLVVLQKKRINIKQAIHFEKDSDQIMPDSFGLLDQIADVLLGHPEVKHVEIQGHTDNQGKRDYNLDLSERRARSVKDYLVNAGVESYRLSAKGFGPDNPVAPNITANGRARNRRVEFHITERE